MNIVDKIYEYHQELEKIISFISSYFSIKAKQ